jgi:hypothetical protein
MSDLQCECPIAGWCERARHNMTPRQHDHCTGKIWPENAASFREQWKAIGDAARERNTTALGIAKKLSCRAATVDELGLRQSAVRAEGPGTELKKLLKSYGVTPAKHCNCNARSREMDRRGVEWCRQNIATIIGWLKEEADKGIVGRLAWSERRAKWFVVVAIRRAKIQTRQQQRASGSPS